jgi:hypothetical protein
MMENKSDITRWETPLRSIVYLSMFVLLVLVAMDNSQSNLQDFIQIIYLLTTIVVITVLVVLNYSKVHFSRSTYEMKELSLENWTLSFLLVMGIVAFFAVFMFSQVSYKEMMHFQPIFEWSDEGFAIYLHTFIQYLLFLLGAASLGIVFTEISRTIISVSMSAEYGEYDSSERSLFIIKLIGNSSNHQGWREHKKYFDDELKQQLVECMRFLKNVVQLDTGGNHWKIDMAWKAVSSELYTRFAKKYGWLEDPNFEIEFQKYCKNQSVYRQFMDKIINDEMDKLARGYPKDPITYRQLCNLLSLFDCDDLIQSSEGNFDRDNFKKKCEQMLFVLRSLKSERESLYSLRKVISSLLRYIDFITFEGQGKLVRDAIDQFSNEGVSEKQHYPLTEKIRFHINTVGDYSLPDVGSNPNEQTPYVRRLEDIVEELSNI